MMSFCPYITFTIVSLCQWNTIASYGKCLLVIRRCLKLYPVSMSVRCDIDLTVIFKSCRALYCLSIPIPFIMPNRLTGAPYLALGNYAIHAYLICLTHVPIIRKPRVLIAFCKCGHDQLYNDGCSSHSIYFRRDLVSPNIKSGLDQSSNCDYRGSLRSTIIFTFSIIPYLILFVKYYFRNQHSDCNTSRK